MEVRKIVIILSCLCFIALATSLLVVIKSTQTQPTGAIVARPGTITNVTVIQEVPTSYWSFSYGHLLSSGQTQYNFSAADIIELNLSTLNVINESTIIVASTTATVNISDLTPVPTAVIDGLMGLGSSHQQSATNTFTDLENITIGNETYEVYSTLTNAYNGTYRTSAFLSSGNVIFITHFVNGTGFNNESVHYQILLPQFNTTMNYYFSVYDYDALTGGAECLSNFEIDAYIHEDNSSVIIYWNATPGALSYNLYYIDGLSEVNNSLIFNSSNVFNNLNTTNYTDATTSGERYYLAEAVFSSGSCLTNNTAATFEMNLTPSSNLISFPLLFSNSSVEEVTRPIQNSFTALNGFNNAIESFGFYIQFGGSVFKNFNDIELGTGYWITVNESASLRIAGRVTQELNETVYDRSNLYGFPVILGNNSVAYTLRSIDGNYTAVNEFDNDAKTFGFYIVFGGSIFNNFNTIKPTRGYWLTANETETLTLP